MELVLEGNSELLTICIVGEVVAATCGELRQFVMEASERRPPRLILDLAEVPFMDTSGIGVLIGLRSHLKGKGVALELARPGERILSVLRSMKLDVVFGLPVED